MDNGKFHQLTELMRKPVRVISPDVLRRIAEPSSRFHSDYLAYRNRKITWHELIERLPHVAMIGDSVCTGVYVSSIWSTFWRARTCRGNNWFLDTTRRPRAFEAFRRNLRSSLRLLRLNARASVHSSITKANGRIFPEESFGRAISRDKLATCWRRDVFPI